MISCQKSADEYYNIAVEDKESDNLISAIENFTKAIEINPQFARAYFERGQTRHKVYLSKYSTIKNEAVTSHPLYKEILTDTLFLSILDDYDKALKLDPNLLQEVQVEKGNIFFSLKDYPKAINEYEKVLQTDPTNKEAIINTEMCILFWGESIEAFSMLDKMVRDEPNNAESYYLRALYKLETNDEKNICDYLEKALELYDDNFTYSIDNLKEGIKRLREIHCNVGQD